MPIDYKYQTDKYTSGDYVEGIKVAFQKRKEIAEILWNFMSER